MIAFSLQCVQLTVRWLVKHRTLIIHIHNANGNWSRDTPSRGAAIVRHCQQQVGVIMTLLIVKRNPVKKFKSRKKIKYFTKERSEVNGK